MIDCSQQKCEMSSAQPRSRCCPERVGIVDSAGSIAVGTAPGDAGLFIFLILLEAIGWLFDPHNEPKPVLCQAIRYQCRRSSFDDMNVCLPTAFPPLRVSLLCAAMATGRRKLS